MRAEYSALTLAIEKAERDARDKQKADKVKVFEDRHRENMQAMVNIQKALVSSDICQERTGSRAGPPQCGSQNVAYDRTTSVTRRPKNGWRIRCPGTRKYRTLSTG